MRLYRINCDTGTETRMGYQGNDDESCYVWASDNRTAIALFQAKHPGIRMLGGIRELFEDTDEPFCTELSRHNFVRST